MKTKILIIEDNELNMELISDLLEFHDFEIYKAYTGIEGIKFLEKMIPDIILLDISLPKMSGVEIIYIIKNQLNIDKPIIAVTSSVMKHDKSVLMKHGFDAIIPKPIDTRTFISTLKKIIERKQ